MRPVSPIAGPARVVRIDPPDGTVGVFRDACVVAHLSQPIDPDSVSNESFCVADGVDHVPATVRMSPDRRTILWQPLRWLSPDRDHRVRLCGVRDSAGADVSAHESVFRSCSLLSQDMAAAD